jgi:hypothetical protein
MLAFAEKCILMSSLQRNCIAAFLTTLVLGICIVSTGCVQDSSSTSASTAPTAPQTIQASSSPNPASGIQGQVPPDGNGAGDRDNSTFVRGNGTMRGGNPEMFPQNMTMMRGNGMMPGGNMTGTPPSGTPPSGTPPSQPAQ